MVSSRQIMMRGVLAGVLVAMLGVGAFLAYVAWYAKTDRLLPGVVVGEVPVGGLRVREAMRKLEQGLRERPPVLAGGGEADGVQAGFAEPNQGRSDFRFRWGEQVWTYDWREIGPVPDTRSALRKAALTGREGQLSHRARLYLIGLVHGHYVPVQMDVRQQVIADKLERIAGELSLAPVDARYDPDSDTVVTETTGHELDAMATLAAARQAMIQGLDEVDLVVKPLQPAVRKVDLVRIRQEQLAVYRTPILAADPGRVQNIKIAVRKMSGTVLQPGELFSFNGIVGPRDAEHGWAQAKELYQGEFVWGYGGGICQVSSTLYNTVLLAGLQVKERFHHDRPLAYVDPGRDATVAWNLLDFKFQNDTQGPMMVVGKVLPGSPQQIEVGLYGPKTLGARKIRVEDQVVQFFPPDLEEVLDPALPVHVRKVVDEGHYGIEVKVFRVIEDSFNPRRELVSHDKYLPKSGKVHVGQEAPSSKLAPIQE
jgi:vancomycin resistance protein YoaR